jgi:hypothetical protein
MLLQILCDIVQPHMMITITPAPVANTIPIDRGHSKFPELSPFTRFDVHDVALLNYKHHWHSGSSEISTQRLSDDASNGHTR